MKLIGQKKTLHDYGSYHFRSERIHTRQGFDGSVIQTFCATVQHRDRGTNRVRENGFYWVVKVTPADGYLADYERGTWAGTAEAKKIEFDKLCVADTKIADSKLLRSQHHTSSGSTYDPRTEISSSLTSDWLTGTWVYADSCATSHDEYFRANGQYDGTAGVGKWSVADDKIILTIASEYVEDGSILGYSPKTLPKPTIKVLDFNRTGTDTAILEGKYSAMRC